MAHSTPKEGVGAKDLRGDLAAHETAHLSVNHISFKRGDLTGKIGVRSDLQYYSNSEDRNACK